MQIIADLQIHSKYSRAVSKNMTIAGIHEWAVKKGIHVVATGDWTHPLWMKEIEANLEEVGNGLLALREKREKRKEKSLPTSGSLSRDGEVFVHIDPLFLLATEVSCIYSQGGKGRRVHTLIWVPSLDSARKINKEMTRQGCNLLSDGRPIIGLTSIQVAELVFTIEPAALIIPAHCWTPWFALYGGMSGFDSINQAFGPYADRIYAVETGLSSNPAMNWQIQELDDRSIVSFSDAHSGPKLGREATVFDIPDGKLSYQTIYEAIQGGRGKGEGERGKGKGGRGKGQGTEQYQAESLSHETDSKSFSPSPLTSLPAIASATAGHPSPLASDNSYPHIAYTIEFYPEEGKYHFSGHRACNIRWGPKETREKGTTCPVCGKPLTQGVVQRVSELAKRTEEEVGVVATQKSFVHGGPEITVYASTEFPQRPGFIMLVPLLEIIAQCLGVSTSSKKVQATYEAFIDAFGSEFHILLHVPEKAIEKAFGARIAQGIEKVRKGDIVIDPGYDGVFGVVKLWKDTEDKPLLDTSKEQLPLL